MDDQTPSKVVATSCSVLIDKVDVAAVRERFPVFAEQPETLFFDNAATTQKPQTVIDAMTRFYTSECANAGRSSYEMSTRLASRIEDVRARVAKFIGGDKADVCFTSGATESLNTVALAWGLHNLKSGDEIMVCQEDHKSTVLPWYNLQRLIRHFGVEIKIVPIRIHPEGDYELKSIREGKTERTRLLAITHVHHLYGLDMEVAAIRAIVGKDILLCVDASQSIGHRDVDVTALQADFLCFSGHKMFAGNGVGVLWVAPRLRFQLHPATVGGGMAIVGDLAKVSVLQDTLSHTLEAGTQNIPAILSLLPAIDFMDEVGIGAIEGHLSRLTKHLYASLKELPGIDFSPGVDRCACHRGFGIVSFRFEQASSSDLAFLLDSENMQVRTGDHCLAKSDEGDEYVRVSLHVYNSMEEIDRFVKVLRDAVS